MTPGRGCGIRAVVQRVKNCTVTVDDRRVSEIGFGLLVLVGVAGGDSSFEVEYMADKVLNLRVFPDEEGRMNLSALEIEAEVMVVSQFTLLADCRKGRRPSFAGAADAGLAESLYLEFALRLEGSGLTVEKGVFGALMNVRLENWGPVTLVMDTPTG